MPIHAKAPCPRPKPFSGRGPRALARAADPLAEVERLRQLHHRVLASQEELLVVAVEQLRLAPQPHQQRQRPLGAAAVAERVGRAGHPEPLRQAGLRLAPQLLVVPGQEQVAVLQLGRLREPGDGPEQLLEHRERELLPELARVAEKEVQQVQNEESENSGRGHRTERSALSVRRARADVPSFASARTYIFRGLPSKSATSARLAYPASWAFSQRWERPAGGRTLGRAGSSRSRP